ncbi:ubiquitin-specific protease ubp2 [Gonapodya sp. JEL0774]|nr:ubiquitin-specific protease ubp2 [Gonapodya sp. JEL0774]
MDSTSELFPSLLRQMIDVATPFTFGDAVGCSIKGHEWHAFSAENHATYVLLDGQLTGGGAGGGPGGANRKPSSPVFLACFPRIFGPDTTGSGESVMLIGCSRCRLALCARMRTLNERTNKEHYHHFHFCDTVNPVEDDTKLYVYSCCECSSILKLSFLAPVISPNIWGKLVRDRSTEQAATVFLCLTTWAKGALPLDEYIIGHSQGGLRGRDLQPQITANSLSRHGASPQNFANEHGSENKAPSVPGAWPGTATFKPLTNSVVSQDNGTETPEKTFGRQSQGLPDNRKSINFGPGSALDRYVGVNRGAVATAGYYSSAFLFSLGFTRDGDGDVGKFVPPPLHFDGAGPPPVEEMQEQEKTFTRIERANWECAFAYWLWAKDVKNATPSPSFIAAGHTSDLLGSFLTSTRMPRLPPHIRPGPQDDNTILGCTIYDGSPAILRAFRILSSHHPELTTALYIPALSRLAQARVDDDLALAAAEAESLDMAGMSQASTVVMEESASSVDVLMRDASQSNSLYGYVEPRTIMLPPSEKHGVTSSIDWSYSAIASNVDSGATTMDLSSAYRLIGIPDSSADPALLRACVAVRLTDSPWQRGKILQAVRVIGNHNCWQWAAEWADKDCPADDDIRGLGYAGWEVPIVVEGGLVESGGKDMPAGLANLGATCYLNSLLQLLFSLRQLRDAVIEEVFGVQAGEANGLLGNVTEIEQANSNRGGIRTVVEGTSSTDSSKKRECLDSKREALIMDRKQTSTLFVHLIFTDSRSVTPPEDLVGIVMQPLDEWVSRRMVKEVVGGVDDEGKHQSTESDSTSTNQTPTNALPAGQKISKVEWSVGAQQDMTEAMDSVSAILEEVLTKSNGPAIQSDSRVADANTLSSTLPSPVMSAASAAASKFLTWSVSAKRKRDPSPDTSQPVTEDVQQGWKVFYGSVTQHLSYHPEGLQVKTATKTESFSHLLVEARDTLQSSLDSYFGLTEVAYEGDSQAKRHVVLARSPPILNIILNRVQFDAGEGRTWKSNIFTEFPLVLDVGRYEVGWERRKELAETDHTLKTTLSNMEKSIRDVGDPEDLEKTLEFVVNNTPDYDPAKSKNIESLKKQIEDARKLKEGK